MDLQSAARSVLASVVSLPGTRPVDLQAGLGLDLKLAWKIARIAQSGDPFDCVRNVPGSEGWTIWLEEAARRHAPEDVVRRARAAYERAIALGTAWAGSRQAFTSMAASASQGSDTRVVIEQRRQFFHAAAFTWGIRAAAALRTDIVAPSADGTMLDCITTRATVDLERVRDAALWRIEALSVIDDAGARRTQQGIERFEKHDRTRLPPFLVRGFSTDPLPPFTAVETDVGMRALELGDTPVGPEGRATIVHGAIVRSMQPRKASKDHHGLFQVFPLRTPVEEQVFDLVLHRDLLAADATPETLVYGDLWRSPRSNRAHASRERLPLVPTLVELPGAHASRGISAKARIAAWPRSLDLLAASFDRVGWKPTDFRFFRATVSYPPVPSTLVLELSL